MHNLNDLTGIPFVNFGRDYSGCDCMGLSMLAHNELGVAIPDFVVDSSNSEEVNKAYIGELNNGRWAKLKEPKIPCLILMGLDSNNPRMVTHVGTYIATNKVLHTLRDMGSHIIDIGHPFYKNKILGFYEYKQNSSNVRAKSLRSKVGF